LISLADARGRADVDLQAAALGALDQFEKVFGPFAM